ncbi:MAG: hypothetical protein ABEJ90_04550 [Halobacterium sp.]
MRHPALPAAVALLVVATALAIPVGAAATPAPAAADTTTTDSPPITGLAFFTTYSGPDTKPLRVGFGAKPGADGFFVLEDGNGTVLGATDYKSYDDAISADGLPIPFDEPVYGHRTITVTAYDDTNGNHEFDPGVDEPYRYAEDDPVRATIDVLFPRTDGAVASVDASMVPATAGEEAVHHYRIETREDVQVRAIALDYRFTGVDAPAVAEGSPTLKVTHGEQTDRIDPDSVTTMMRDGVAVLRFDDPVSIPAGAGAVLSVSEIRNPVHPVNATLLVNPEGSADGATMHFEPDRGVPDLRSADLTDDGSTVSVNAYFPSGAQAVVRVRAGGTEIGRAGPIGGQPNMHVDFFEVPLDRAVDPDETVTVELLGDRDGDGTYEEPIRWDGERAAIEVTAPAAATTTTTTRTSTTTPTTDGTTTTTSTTGFGVLAALGALAALALAFSRHE